MLNPRKKLFRWGPIGACPLFMYFAIAPAFASMKKLIGYSYPESVVMFRDNKVTWLMDEEVFHKTSKAFLTNVILDEKKLNQYLSLWQTRTEVFVRYIERFETLQLSSFSHEQLRKEFADFSNIYFDWFAITISVEMTTAVESLLREKLKAYFPQEHPKEFNHAFSLLTAPTELTFYRREQRDLLKILEAPPKRRTTLLQKHQKDFHWILNSYLKAKTLSVSYFKKALEAMEKEDWKNILYEILTYDKVILSQKEKILDTIHPSSEVLKLIAICTKFSLLQDDRKMYNFLGDSLLEAFVTEFAKRTTFSVPDLKLLTHTDIIKKLETVDKKDLEARKIAYVFECTDTGISSLVGDKALQLFDYLNTAQDVDQSILHGVLASPGTDYYFRGIARVILDIKHINRLKEGEILVTTMTSPDFVVGMKKAGAIVTDTGGILSHAAIVSRELRKPCIVGTGIATKVIKDGDIVELHCGRGTVKVIKNH